jgi:hypothetical protein
MKKINLVFYLILLVFLAACTHETYTYTGDYPDLYTEAIYSIPNTSGFILSEIYESPRIKFIESDNHNRKLFLYYEGNNISTYSLLILQYSTGDEVCFYFDNNYISSPTEEFEETSISQLKSDNDWNIELDESKSECVSITSSKAPLPLSYEQIKPFYESVFPGDKHFSDDRWIRYYQSDSYGRILVTVEARNVDEWAIMMFYPDGTFDNQNGFLVLSDYYTYQNQLEEFKEDNNWNEPLD